MNIVNVGYDSTNYYILETHNGTLLVDCGWHWVKWVTEVEVVSIFYRGKIHHGEHGDLGGGDAVWSINFTTESTEFLVLETGGGECAPNGVRRFERIECVAPNQSTETV